MFIGEILIREQLTTKRGHNQLMSRENKREALHHKQHILPRHFEPGAYVRYRYDRRTRTHEERKRRRFGHNRPLVFRDNLRPIVLGRAIATGTAHRWRVTTRGTNAHPLSTKHKIELERVSDKEKRESGQRIARNYRRAVRNGDVAQRKRKRLNKI